MVVRSDSSQRAHDPHRRSITPLVVAAVVIAVMLVLAATLAASRWVPIRVSSGGSEAPRIVAPAFDSISVAVPNAELVATVVRDQDGDKVDIVNAATGNVVGTSDVGLYPVVVWRRSANELLISDFGPELPVTQARLSVFDVKTLQVKAVVGLPHRAFYVTYDRAVVLSRDESTLFYVSHTYANDPACEPNGGGTALVCDIYGVGAVRMDTLEHGRGVVLPQGCGLPVLSPGPNDSVVVACSVAASTYWISGAGEVLRSDDFGANVPRWGIGAAQLNRTEVTTGFVTRNGSPGVVLANGDVLMLEDGKMRFLSTISDRSTDPRVIRKSTFASANRLYVTHGQVVDGLLLARQLVVVDLDTFAIAQRHDLESMYFVAFDQAGERLLAVDEGGGVWPIDETGLGSRSPITVGGASSRSEAVVVP